MNLEAILNYAIPILVVLIFCGIFYSRPKIKGAVDAVIRWIFSGFAWAAGRTKQKAEDTYERRYTYG